MKEQQTEIETINPRTYHLNLSDNDVKRLALKADECNLNVSELLENFIGDLISGTYSNGSDERMYANQWFDRYWFSFEPENDLIQYLCSSWESNFTDFMDILERINDIESDIKTAENNIANPGNRWKNIVYRVYNNDQTNYTCVPCYNSVEEYIESEKQDLIDYKDALQVTQEELNDLQNSFRAYMNGKKYVWDQEVKKAVAWYKENISDKLEEH